jgi:hypothetical protein
MSCVRLEVRRERPLCIVAVMSGQVYEIITREKVSYRV